MRATHRHMILRLTEIFEADWDSMQRANQSSVFIIVVVESLSIPPRLFVEDCRCIGGQLVNITSFGDSSVVSLVHTFGDTIGDILSEC